MQNSDQNDLDHLRLQSLVNSMADGVIALDDTCHVVLYNGATLDVLDINSVAAGDDIADVLKLRDAAGNTLDSRAVVLATQKQVISRDYTIKYRDDSLVHIYLSISPVRQGYGTQSEKGYVLIIRDITREKSLEEERDEFISVVSHELRTPAATIEGSVSNALFLAEKKPDDHTKIVEMLQNAHDQALYLEDMINDLTTLARAEQGALKESVSKINTHTIVEGLLASYSNSAQEKGLSLQADIDPHLEILHSVELYVREVLQNFVTNAIKYTEKGSVTIHARQADGGIEFAVSDTGIGISTTDQNKVFDKFFRSEDLLTRKQSGTGLGLHVTSKLAKLAQARISLESQLGEGSTFTIYFPNLDA